MQKWSEPKSIQNWKPATTKHCAKARILQAWDCKYRVGNTVTVTQQGYGKTQIKTSFDDLKAINPSRSLLTCSKRADYCLCGNCTVNGYTCDALNLKAVQKVSPTQHAFNMPIHNDIKGTSSLG